VLESGEDILSISSQRRCRTQTILSFMRPHDSHIMNPTDGLPAGAPVAVRTSSLLVGPAVGPQ